MKSVKHEKGEFVVKVLENKALLPTAVSNAVKGAGDAYSYDGMSIEAVGKVEKDGDNYAFVARANGQKFTLTVNEDLKKLVADGKVQLLLVGSVTEPEEKDGKKPLPAIEVSSAKEPPKEEKK